MCIYDNSICKVVLSVIGVLTTRLYVLLILDIIWSYMFTAQVFFLTCVAWIGGIRVEECEITYTMNDNILHKEL